MIAKVNQIKSNKGEIIEKDWVKLTDAISQASDLSIVTDDNTQNDISLIMDKIINLESEVGVHMVLIDFLQMIRKIDPHNCGQAIKKLSDFSSQHNLPVILSMQLDPPSPYQVYKQPTLAALRTYGIDENHVTSLIFLNRELNQKQSTSRCDLSVTVAKGRVLGEVKLRYDPRCGLIYEPQKKK